MTGFVAISLLSRETHVANVRPLLKILHVKLKTIEITERPFTSGNYVYGTERFESVCKGKAHGGRLFMELSAGD
jgi:hypothetical protein